MSSRQESVDPGHRVGSILGGRFRIDEGLAIGGMAAVYRGYDLRTDRRVAVKILLEEFESRRDIVARFRGEAATLETLDHPHVVEVFECGTAEGAIFIAMALLEGRTLRQHLAEHGTMPPRIALRSLLPVLDALNDAHRLGIVHRDLKPENLMLSPAVGGWHATLLDFGIAKVADISKTRRTVEGVVLGTVPYMSPEQIMDSRSVGPQTDVWSMGVLIYLCLSGELPFRGVNATSIASAILQAAPPSSKLDPAGVPKSFIDVLDRCLARDLDLRYPDMECVSLALLDAAREAGVTIGDDIRHCGVESARQRIAALPALDVRARGGSTARPRPLEGKTPRSSAGPTQRLGVLGDLAPATSTSGSEQPPAAPIGGASVPPAGTFPGLGRVASRTWFLVAAMGVWVLTAVVFFELGRYWPHPPGEDEISPSEAGASSDDPSSEPSVPSLPPSEERAQPVSSEGPEPPIAPSPSAEAAPSPTPAARAGSAPGVASNRRSGSDPDGQRESERRRSDLEPPAASTSDGPAPAGGGERSAPPAEEPAPTAAPRTPGIIPFDG